MIEVGHAVDRRPSGRAHVVRAAEEATDRRPGIDRLGAGEQPAATMGDDDQMVAVMARAVAALRTR